MVTQHAESPWRGVRDRSQERDAKREALLQSAARLFTAQGFQGTSLDDIAHSLGVSKPTLYHYIENKEEILFACLQRGLRDVEVGLSGLEDLQGRDRLLAVLRAYAAAITSDFGLCLAHVGDDSLPEARRRELRTLRRQIDTALELIIDRGMADGSIASGDAAAAVRAVVGTLGGIGRWGADAAALRQAVDQGIRMLMQGVLGSPRNEAQANDSLPAMRRELHFENRFMRCFAERPTHLAQMLAAAVEQRPDGEALVCDELRLTWRELHHAARKCAGGLVSRGVQAGDRVALFMGNGPEFVITTLACAWMGAVLVPISSRARGAELEHALVDSGAVAIVCAEELMALVPAALPSLRHRFSTGSQTRGAFEPVLALMQAAPLQAAHEAREEDLAVLLYTSGTTGLPKGAMLTQLNIAHSVLHYAHLMAVDEHDRSLVAVPLSHVTGLVAQLVLMLQVRGCMVLMRQFKAAEFMRLAERERITHTIMVPAMYNLCLLLPDLKAHDLSAWRIGAYGGASMPTATIEGLAERLPGLTLMNAYGATETTSPATIVPRGQTDAHRDSVGLPVPCGDVLVTDEQGIEVPRGQVGEIWIAGPMVVPGYWNNPQATASEFRCGYWRSGDIGSQDSEGFVRILDRKKDVINRGGYKIFCASVENRLAEHPQVVESALVGVPCAVLGERVHAFVCVTVLDDSTAAAALQAFCAAGLADYAVPETWSIGTEPLPRNLNGKVMKRQLRQKVTA
jgi:acyl-CoA synthetase (AMP-forming)/AMP-acid ligase II/AcrR family transcriptional regulator